MWSSEIQRRHNQNTHIVQLNSLKVPRHQNQTGWDCWVAPSPPCWWLLAEVWRAVPEQQSDVHRGFYLPLGLQQVHEPDLGRPSSPHQQNTEAIEDKSRNGTGWTCREFSHQKEIQKVIPSSLGCCSHSNLKRASSLVLLLDLCDWAVREHIFTIFSFRYVHQDTFQRCVCYCTVLSSC